MSTYYIPEGSTSIPPDTAEIIQEGGFTSVNIPDSVIIINGGAFDSCNKLHSIKIPDSVTVIDDYAFGKCSMLSSINIPNSLSEIGSSAFECCTSLKSVKLPNSITEIKPFTFYECESLLAIKIPNSVTKIGERAFYNCTKLKSVHFPESVCEIGEDAFYNCDLAKISLPEEIIFDTWPFDENPRLDLLNTFPLLYQSVEKKFSDYLSRFQEDTYNDLIFVFINSIFSAFNFDEPNEITYFFMNHLDSVFDQRYDFFTIGNFRNFQRSMPHLLAPETIVRVFWNLLHYHWVYQTNSSKIIVSTNYIQAISQFIQIKSDSTVDQNNIDELINISIQGNLPDLAYSLVDQFKKRKEIIIKSGSLESFIETSIYEENTVFVNLFLDLSTQLNFSKDQVIKQDHNLSDGASERLIAKAISRNSSEIAGLLLDQYDLIQSQNRQVIGKGQTLDQNSIDRLIDFAIKQNNTEITSQLLQYSNKLRFSNDRELSDHFEL